MARRTSDDMDERLTALLSAEEADDAAADRRLRTAEPGPATHRSTLLTVCPFILGNEFCERLAYYGWVPVTCFRLRRLDIPHQHPKLVSNPMPMYGLLQ